MAPVAPGTRPELAALETRILGARGRISRLYAVLLNSPPLASGWEQLLTALRKHSTVPPALRELAILRVATLNGATYEFDAHVPHAREAGLPAERIEALREDRTDAFRGLEQLVLQYTDAMTRDIRVGEELFGRLSRRFEPQALVELTATIAAYNMVSRFLVALHIGHREKA